MKKALMKMGGKNIDVVYDGVDSSIFKPYNMDKKDSFVMVYEGGMDLQDGLDILIPAAVKIVEKIPNAEFLMVGDGKVVPKIKQEIKRFGLERNFVFTGWVRYEDVAKHISRADMGLVILPDTISARTRVTLKTFEYWACGKPIIAPRLEALTEIIDEKNGVLYHPENPESLANSVIKIYEDHELRWRLEMQSLKEAKKYEWSKLGDDIASIFSHIGKETK